ncbi:hypothetical protein [Flavobacterium subsaxonicum]|uniref:DUF1735 domain-containing protein n=1 Tax=Flavobacterium subsaxonicum WB 4.1-42 = DSM 21790 TaxID=1121898 RepID=A0A0A2MNU3_9FLAO|nr:hypothetical protein [Flavobacterium subsaxonicum]KGO94352.1 hypothetical protein Q766_05385 [Flavobacterium subsaxonicum WB 4.1-42 = DSM 21790]
MKNIFYKLSLACLFAAALTSCSDDDRVVLNPNNTQNLFSFNESSSTLTVTNEVRTDTIEVGVTSLSNVDREIPINIDATSTATPDLYSFKAGTLVIPAGKFIGYVILEGNFANLPDGATYTLVITLDESQVGVLDERNFHVVTITKNCVSESLGGTHSYKQYNMVGGTEGPVATEKTGTMVWSQTAAGTGIFKIADLSWGLFTTVRGINAATVAGGNNFIQWTCTGLRANTQDQFGDSYTYDVVSVNGPVFTFNWTNTHGDSGTVEVTRNNGKDWPTSLLTQ